MRGLMTVRGPVADVVDEDPPLHADLIGRQPGARARRTSSRSWSRPGCATAPSMSSTSRVRSLSTGSPYCRMVRLGHGAILTAAISTRAATAARCLLRARSDRPRRAGPRPAGRGTRGQQVAELAMVGRLHEDTAPRPAGRPRRPGVAGGRRRPDASAYAGGQGPRHQRPAPRTAAGPQARRIASSAARTSAGSPRATAARTGWSGTRVWTSTRADAGPAPAGADQAGGPDQEGQRLVGGAESRGAKQVEVDVEEGHGRRPGGPGAAPPRCRSATGRRRARRRRPRLARRAGPDTSPTSTPEQRRQLLAQPASRRPAASSSAAARRRRRRRARLAPAARAAQHLLVLGCATAAPQRVHCASSPQWAQASRRAPPVRS